MFDDVINYLQFDFIDALAKLVPVIISLLAAFIMGLLIHFLCLWKSVPRCCV